MSDKIMVQWADMTEKTAHLIPWWVGCQVVERGSRLLYWRPVEDAVNERVNHDIEAWLTTTGRDYVLVELGRPGLQLFKPGRITKFNDGGIGYELEITDAVAHSRDLAEVQAFLVEKTMAGLTAIATKLGVAPPPTGTSDTSPTPRGRLADIATKHGGGRPLVLISPRFRHRPRLDQLKASFAGNEIPTDDGWATYAVNPDVTSQQASIDTDFDFTGIERPFDPDTLLTDSQIVLLLVASAEHPVSAQREQLAACVALVNEHIPTEVRLAGNDSGVMWLATTMKSPQGQI